MEEGLKSKTRGRRRLRRRFRDKNAAELGKEEKRATSEERREMIELLMAKCELTETEVLEAEKNFIAANPSGVISKEEFILSMKDVFLAESLFRVFDEDKSGALNFYEFLQEIMSQLKSVKTIESAEDKLGWIFTAFDEDGGGTMDPEEVAQIVLGLFRMAGIPEDDEMMPSCVDDVRASIDLDGDGDITKEEFVRNALKNDFISKLLKYETDISEN